MKVQASSNPLGYYDTETHEMVYHVGDVIEMDVKDGVASVPTPLLMIGNRPLDMSGVIIEDKLPPSAKLVSAKYQAASRLTYLTTGVIAKRG